MEDGGQRNRPGSDWPCLAHWFCGHQQSPVASGRERAPQGLVPSVFARGLPKLVTHSKDSQHGCPCPCFPDLERARSWTVGQDLDTAWAPSSDSTRSRGAQTWVTTVWIVPACAGKGGQSLVRGCHHSLMGCEDSGPCPVSSCSLFAQRP